MTETALLTAYGMISILVLVGYSWLMRDVRRYKRQNSQIIKRLTWAKKREAEMLTLLKTLQTPSIVMPIEKALPIVYPKGRNAKNYVLWSRKGNCPGCSVSTGIKHREGCETKAELLKQL